MAAQGCAIERYFMCGNQTVSAESVFGTPM